MNVQDLWWSQLLKTELIEKIKSYPLVLEYLQSIPEDLNTMDIGHHLQFTNDPDCDLFEQYENIIQYYANNISVMAEWNYLANFIKLKFKTLKVVWDNESNGCGSIDFLELFEWADIVKDILKQKCVLPTLMGINQELNELIGITLKE
jgi:hypothetical protein